MVTQTPAGTPRPADDEPEPEIVRRPLTISPEAAAGDLTALARAAAAAGWRLKITQREPMTVYANDVEIELSSYEESAGGTPSDAWLGPRDERGSRMLRRPPTPDAWYADRTIRITGTAPTVERACAMLAEAVRHYEAGWKPRPVWE
jgi:hypothetical protein